MITRRDALKRGAIAAAFGAPGFGAQSQDRRLRVSLIVATEQADPDGRARANAFSEGLRQLGWIEGRNVEIDHWWGAGEPGRVAGIVDEVMRSVPDVIVSNGTPMLSALRSRVANVPIVFVVVTNPVGAGFVQSLARPGANITGLSTYEPEIGAKWFETLREFDPDIRRVAVVLDFVLGGFAAVASALESFARKADVDVERIEFRTSGDDVERRIAGFASRQGGGIVAMPTAINLLARDRLISAAARHRLPAIYPFRPFVLSGGLMSYGFEPLDLFRRSAVYVDRIFKGERPGDLPVEVPTRFQLVLNLRTAEALGLRVPAMLLARVDEVIE